MYFLVKFHRSVVKPIVIPGVARNLVPLFHQTSTFSPVVHFPTKTFVLLLDPTDSTGDLKLEF